VTGGGTSEFLIFRNSLDAGVETAISWFVSRLTSRGVSRIVTNVEAGCDGRCWRERRTR